MAADKLTKGGPSPEKAYKPRSTGSHLVPERATPRYTGSKRGQYPKGSEPMPERTRGRSSGSSQSNTMKSNVVQPVVTREGGGHGNPAGSRSNPFKTQGGNDKSRI